MNFLSKIISIFENKHFKLIISLLVPTIFFCTIYHIAQFDQIFQYTSDEGFYFMRSFLHMKGFVLYEDIWMDQPPVLVKMLTIAFQLFGPSVVVARTMILLLISLMMMALFIIINRSQNMLSAIMTMALICSIPNFILYSVSAMNGLPSIALAIISCLGIYFYEIHRKAIFLIGSAFFLSIALQTKLLVFVFVPAIIIELIYIEYKKFPEKLGLNHLRPVLVWITGVFIIYFALAFALGVDYTQIFKPYTLAKAQFPQRPYVRVMEWISENKEIILLAGGSLLCFRPKSMKLFFIPLVVTVISFFLFSYHAPIWDHHRLHLFIPAAWLASFSVYEFFSLKRWKELKEVKGKTKIWMMFKFVYIGIAIIVVLLNLKLNAYWAKESLNKTSLYDVQDVIDLINQNKNKASMLVTDRPSYAFHTQVLIPPSLSTISKKQTKTGLITTESIIPIINRGQADMILWSRFPELGEKVMQSVGTHYDLVYQSKVDDTKLYFLKGAQKDSIGFKGFGKNTVGGQGGAIYTVKNLNANGPGSLLEGINGKGPRDIQFAVSGIINLTEPLVVTNPYLTIDGASAPAPGITLTGAGIIIETSEVIVSHLKVRVGDQLHGPDPQDRDGIAIHVPQGSNEPIENIVIDHCSVSWGVDENIGLWVDGNAQLRNVTISHNIISEGLKHSIHPEGQHSMGLLIGDNVENISIIGNVFAHNNGRNPQLKGGVKAEVFSNIMYNPGQPSIGLSDPSGSGPISVQIVGNYFIPGRDTKHSDKHLSLNPDVAKNSQLYLAENYDRGINKNDQWGMLQYKGQWSSQEKTKIQTVNPLWFVRYASTTLDDILTNAGAFADSRDAIDQRIIRDVRNLTGRHVNEPYFK